MDPQSQERAGFNLPMPMESSAAHSGQPAAPEMAQNPLQPVAANTPPQLPQMPQFATPPINQQVPQMPVNGAIPTTTNDVSATADDADLIEKEWVMRAKRIVDATRDDPYKQSQELTAVKADYMQKRYNKTIKQSE